MPKLFRIFLTGMFISFLGSLPLGTLNVAAMQIAVYKGIAAALWFSSGSLTVEVIYVRLSLVAMDWVRKQKLLFRLLEYLTLVIVLALAASSFYAAWHTRQSGAEPVTPPYLQHALHPYVLGLFMSAVNPVQIPFWFGWSTVLFTKKVLLPRNDHYNTYIAGIGLGTLLGNFVFVFGGAAIAHSISGNQDLLNWIIGGIFLLTALIQIYKMVRNKGADYQLDHPEEQSHPFEDEVGRLK